MGGRGRGLIGTVARTAVIAGTASAVAGRVAQHREARKHHQQAQVDEQVAASRPTSRRPGTERLRLEGSVLNR